ncbi:hydroxypyruvate isomerase [Paenibacillus taihuensis]|uniref:Hydroxypyruvate isomerase n=1 Tax=Paenibacillus taihuensis TaxID=1156355 RepID=A0A3D9QVF7_9BACL|nr:TIM barrel protein [Paenibacillus taihuensis]REE68087.1 hydroxypyruvate isomerase [Paenibacillus taihuensis]
MKFSICIGAYSGKDEVYHLEKIKEHGLHGLEYYAWWDLKDIRHTAKEQERIGVGINATCTKFISLVNESLRDAYIDGVRQSIEACKLLNIRSMISQTGNVLDGIPRYIQRANMIETLKRCAPLLEEAGVVLEIEPLNGLVDHAGHFSQRSDESVYIIDQVGSPNVKLVFDVYHQQITEGNVSRNAVNYIDRINHFHIADNPGRKQPGTGELNYVNILKAIKGTGFDGFVGLECGYTVDTDIAIEQFKRDIVAPALG